MISAARPFENVGCDDVFVLQTILNPVFNADCKIDLISENLHLYEN
jgi:hypothetical protein